MTDHRRENWTVVRVRRGTLDAVRARGTNPQAALEAWLADHMLVDAAIAIAGPQVELMHPDGTPKTHDEILDEVAAATAGVGHVHQVAGPHGEIVSERTGEVERVGSGHDRSGNRPGLNPEPGDASDASRPAPSAQPFRPVPKSEKGKKGA